MPYQKNNVIEICVDSLESSLLAADAGASRVELCASLIEGGITPAYSLMQAVCELSAAKVYVMIRPRGGDFLYSGNEFDLMKQDIIMARDAGAHGVVFGILSADGSVDMVRCQVLMNLAKPMKTTFHRAFDMCSDPFRSLEEIISLGFDNLLTSGQRQTAEDGLDMIKELVKRAAGRINIVAGGGINASNVSLLRIAGIREFHFTARKVIDGPMKYRNEALTSMGSRLPGKNSAGEYDLYVFDEDKVHAILQALS